MVLENADLTASLLMHHRNRLCPWGLLDLEVLVRLDQDLAWHLGCQVLVVLVQGAMVLVHQGGQVSVYQALHLGLDVLNVRGGGHMPIERALTMVDARGSVLWDVDPSVGAKDFGARVIDGVESVTVSLLAAMAVNGFIWTVHEGIWRVGTVAGSAGATAQVVVCPQSVAVASGTVQLAAALDLTIVAPVVRFGTLIAPPTLMTRGDSLGYLMTGTLTNLVGVLTVNMWRVG